MITTRSSRLNRGPSAWEVHVPRPSRQFGMLEHSGIFGGIRIHHKDPRVLTVISPDSTPGTRTSLLPHFQPSIPGNPLPRQGTGSSGPLLSPSRIPGRVRSIKRDRGCTCLPVQVQRHARRRGRANYRARPRALELEHSFRGLPTPRYEVEGGPGTSGLILGP